jgi:CTP-dependent riboflavin kinase
MRKHYYEKRIKGDYFELWIGNGKGEMQFIAVIKSKNVKIAAAKARQLSTLSDWYRDRRLKKLEFEDEIYRWVEEEGKPVWYVEMIIKISEEKGIKLKEAYGLGNELASYAR